MSNTLGRLSSDWLNLAAAVATAMALIVSLVLSAMAVEPWVFYVGSSTFLVTALVALLWSLILLVNKPVRYRSRSQAYAPKKVFPLAAKKDEIYNWTSEPTPNTQYAWTLDIPSKKVVSGVAPEEVLPMIVPVVTHGKVKGRRRKEVDSPVTSTIKIGEIVGVTADGKPLVHGRRSGLVG